MRRRRVLTALGATALVVFCLAVTVGRDLCGPVRAGDGLTPLARAALRGHINTARLFIAFGADVNARDRTGWTPLHYTMRPWGTGGTNVRLARLLLEHGADPDAAMQDGRTLLHVAAARGEIEAAKLLLSKGADANARDLEGCTPVLYAVNGGRTKMVGLLLDSGTDADPDELLLAEGRRRPWPVESSGETDDTELVRLLLDRGADVNTKDEHDGSTALHLAAALGRTETARLLLARGAKASAKDRQGKTPRQRALTNGQSATVDLLQQAGGAE